MFGFGKKKEEPKQSATPQLSPEEIAQFRGFQTVQKQMLAHGVPEYEDEEPKKEQPAEQPAEQTTGNIASKVSHAFSGASASSKNIHKRRIVQSRADNNPNVAEEAIEEDDLSSLGDRIQVLRKKAKVVGSATGTQSQEEFADQEQNIGVTDAESRLMIAEELLHPKDQWLDVGTITPPHCLQPFVIATSVNEIEPIVIMPRIPNSARRDYLNWLKHMTNTSAYSEAMRTWVLKQGINFEELEQEIIESEQNAKDYDPKKVNVESLPYYTMSTKGGSKNTGVNTFIRKHDRRMMSFKGESQKNALEIMEIKSGHEEDESMRSTKRF